MTAVATKARPVSKAKAPRKVTPKAAPAPSTSYLLGGYDAKNCPEALRKNLDPFYADAQQDPIPSGDMARMNAGIVFEQDVKKAWKKALGRKIATVDECDRTPESKAKREAQTLALLADPGDAQVIWNARLPQQFATHRTGEPDALLLVGRSVVGTPQWVPVDVKDHSSLEGTSKKRETRASSMRRPHPDAANTVDIGPGTPRKSDALQLAHYRRMLETLGYAADVNIGAIVGREMQVVWHDLDEPLYRHHELGTISAQSYYDHEFAVRTEIADAAIAGTSTPNPEWKTECQSCVWRSTCHDELKVDLDHITLLPGITPLRAKAHYKQGVTSKKQLAKLKWATARLVDQDVDVPAVIAWAQTAKPSDLIEHVPGIKPAHVSACKDMGISTAKNAATLDAVTAAYHGSGVWNLAGSIDQARVATVGKVYRARGVDHVGFTRVGIEEDIDIEDYQGYVYMIGVRDTGRKKVGDNVKARAEYHAFVNWDGTEDGEARVFAEFWAHVQMMREKAVKHKCGYRAYHFTHHEPAAFRQLATCHAGKPGVPDVADIEAYFASPEVIDLHPVLSKQLIWPTESVTLKETAKWVRFSWRDSDPGGGNSLAWYVDATEHPDEAVREENRARLLEYNADDVEAQIAIRDWLTRLGEARQPGGKLPSVSDLDKRISWSR